MRSYVRPKGAIVTTSIRLADAADAERLTQLARSSAAHWGYPDELLAAWDDELCIAVDFIESSTVLCAVEDADILGFAATEQRADGVRLRHMWVRPDRIGTGIGRILFDSVVERCVSDGVRQLRFISDPHAAGFYERMGARVVSHVESVPPGMTQPVFEFDVPSVDGSSPSA